MIQVLAFKKEGGTLICTQGWDLQGGMLLQPHWSDLHAMIFHGYLAEFDHQNDRGIYWHQS